MKIEKKRRVVITGLGTVNPTGNTVAESWAAVKAGRCAVGPITAFDTTDFKVKLAAEVKDFDPAERIDRREARKMARFTQFAVAAADEAIQDSGIALENIDHTRFGVILSSGIGGLPTIEEEHTRGQQRGFEKVSPYFVPMSIGNMAAGLWPAGYVQLPHHCLRRRYQCDWGCVPPYPRWIRGPYALRRQRKLHQPVGGGRLRQHESPLHRRRPGPGLDPL